MAGTTSARAAARRRIRLAHVVGSFDIGGTELNAVRVVERLDRARFDVRVLCLSTRGPLRERCVAAGVPVVPFEIAGFARARTLERVRGLWRYLRAERIDIVHAHDVYSNIFSVPTARAALVPVVIASRRWWTETNRAAHRWLNRAASRMAHRILTNAPSVAAMVVRDEGVPEAKVAVVPNFVDEAAFTPPGDAAIVALRHRLGVSPADLAVGIVANLRRIKGHRFLLDAFASLADEFPGARLVLVGEGDERGAIEAQARDSGLSGRVILTGQLPPDPSPHWCFDVSVLSSLGEAFPNSVVEAMAAGRPVVAARVGGVPDAVLDGETGYLVEPGSAEALAARLRSLLRDRQLREAMGEAGRRVARERFFAGTVLARLEAVYEEALAASEGGFGP